MEHDLDQFGRDLEERVKWMVSELTRLTAENDRLLRENKELREEATLTRLKAAIGEDGKLPGALEARRAVEPEPTSAALQFYRNLPEKINFPDFFRHAEAAGLTNAKAREFMLTFFRNNMLEQRGKRLEKSASVSKRVRRQVQDV